MRIPYRSWYLNNASALVQKTLFFWDFASDVNYFRIRLCVGRTYKEIKNKMKFVHTPNWICIMWLPAVEASAVPAHMRVQIYMRIYICIWKLPNCRPLTTYVNARWVEGSLVHMDFRNVH